MLRVSVVRKCWTDTLTHSLACSPPKQQGQPRGVTEAALPLPARYRIASAPHRHARARVTVSHFHQSTDQPQEFHRRIGRTPPQLCSQPSEAYVSLDTVIDILSGNGTTPAKRMTVKKETHAENLEAGRQSLSFAPGVTLYVTIRQRSRSRPGASESRVS